MFTKPQTGFTLIEAMVTVVLLAVVFAIGVPSFQNSGRNTRMTVSVNDLSTAFQLARSEAVKRRTPVVMCPVDPDDPDAGCDATRTWADGWVVFADNNGDGALTLTSPADPIVQRHAPITTTGTVLTLTPQVNQFADRIVYTPSGFPRPYADGTTGGTILFCDDRQKNDVARVLTVSQTGRPAVGGYDRLPGGLDLSCESL